MPGSIHHDLQSLWVVWAEITIEFSKALTYRSIYEDFYEKEYRWILIILPPTFFCLSVSLCLCPTCLSVCLSLEWFCNIMTLSMHLILLSVPLGEVKARPLRNKSNLTLEKDNLGYSWAKWIGRDLCGLLDLGHPISVSTDEKKLVAFVLTPICTDRMVLWVSEMLLAHPH